MEIITESPEATQEFGQKFTDTVRKGGVVALSGTLGAGKTAFVQGLAKGLGITERIISPTFILMRQYNNLYHLDLYRLEKELEEEIENLGLPQIWNQDSNIVVIEWAEKIKDLLPQNTIFITFEVLAENRRKITIS